MLAILVNKPKKLFILISCFVYFNWQQLNQSEFRKEIYKLNKIKNKKAKVQLHI